MGNALVVQASCATLSWIDPKADLPEYDHAGMPVEALGIDGLTRQRNCRFGHVLTASVFIENGRITRRWLDKQTGLYPRPSYKDTPPLTYPMRQDIDDWNEQRAVFVHTVGCRTQAPEVIGEAVAGGVATGLGPNSPVDPVTARRIGNAAARATVSFPPIWTKLKITIRADGTWDADCIEASLFPSRSFYRGVAVKQMVQGQIAVWKRISSYDGVPHYNEWLQNGFGRGNPWRVTDHQAHPLTWGEAIWNARSALPFD
jgi:hypothetical protein